HIALEHFVALGKGIGVLGLPHRTRALDQAVERAAAPAVPRTGEALANPPHLLVRELLEPLPVEGLGPAAEHHRQRARQVLGLGFAALLAPQTVDPCSIAREDDVGIASADEGA